VNYSISAENYVLKNVETAELLYPEHYTVDTQWICTVVLSLRDTNVQWKWRLNCLIVGT
jgi:hypothetical protein